MKKLTVLFFVIFISLSVNAQFKLGLRGGISTSQVDLTKAINVAQENDNETTLNFTSNTPFGFHLGAVAQISILGFFIQPEALFTTTGHKVTIKEIQQTDDYFYKVVKQRDFRLDIPVLMGVKFGPARLGVGPVASINLYTKDKVSDAVNEAVGTESTSTKTSFNDVVWSLQFGAGLDILKLLAIDVKYELGLNKFSDGIRIGNHDYRFSKKANQFILSIGVFF